MTRALASEATPCGAQILIPGVRPVTLRERLMRAMDAPFAPTKTQKPFSFGLFDLDSRKQLDLF